MRPCTAPWDLAYESDGAWHVVDFKTDEAREDALAEAAAPYLPQLALYSAALEHAIGTAPQGQPVVPQDVPALYSIPRGVE